MRIKNFIKSLSKRTKVAVASLALVVAVGVPVAVNAGYGPNGPDRVIYDFSNPAQREGAFDAPRFNSYINTDVYGDERGFLDAKECVVNGAQCYSQGQSGGFRDQQPVTPGKEYMVRAYVHNIANPSINASGKGVAKNTRIRVELPTGTGNGFTMQARISADNSIPTMVYDTVDLKNPNQAFNVEYVPGSAYISNFAHPGGLQLSDNIMSANGTPLGYQNMDGVYPGCFEYSAFVTIRVKIVAPKLEIRKRVTTPGSTDWRESITAKKGDTVSWLINYDIKDSPAKDVVIRDVMPKGVTLVPGTITLFNPNNPNGKVLPDTALGSGGVNVGDYAAGAGGMIRFRTTVDQDPPKECVAVNVAFARASNINEISDDAKVVVENCKPASPVYTCDDLQVTSLGSLKYRFTVKYTAQNGATFKSSTFDFGDGSQPLLTDQTTVDYTYAKKGTFAPRAVVTFTVDGKDVAVNGDQCASTVTITDYCTVTGKENLPVDSPDCKTDSAFCTIPGKENLPVNSPECVLPNTGIGDLFGLFTATTIAGGVAHHVFASRRFTIGL